MKRLLLKFFLSRSQLLIVSWTHVIAKHMEDNLKTLAPKLESFCVEQHQMELERFKFVINKYYRTRLEKIEKNASNLVKNDPASKILSKLEKRYLDQFVSSIHEHLKESRLQKLPCNMESFKLEDVPQGREIREQYSLRIRQSCQEDISHGG